MNNVEKYGRLQCQCHLVIFSELDYHHHHRRFMSPVLWPQHASIRCCPEKCAYIRFARG